MLIIKIFKLINFKIVIVCNNINDILLGTRDVVNIFYLNFIIIKYMKIPNNLKIIIEKFEMFWKKNKKKFSLGIDHINQIN